MASSSNIRIKMNSDLHPLRDEMTRFYGQISSRVPFDQYPSFCRSVNAKIWETMDEFDRNHPGTAPCLLKARLYEEITERFAPVIFPHSPFFYEMGLRPAENWGTPAYPIAGGWMRFRRDQRFIQLPEFRYLMFFGRYGQEHESCNLWRFNGFFDIDHHSLNYSLLLKDGVNGILRELGRRREDQSLTPDQQAFLEAAERGCLALIRVAERFAEKADELLMTPIDAESRRFLNLVARSARHVPAEPPRTFYEGLAMLWFLREVTATLDSIGISVLGHLDRLLVHLYRKDIAEKRLTEAEAADLLARWMLPTDIKFHVDDNSWPETSTCVELGGCDEDGQPVFNELTRLIVDTHRQYDLVNPKLNCRFNRHSSDEYLDRLCEHSLSGHNVFAFLNDEILIPACMKAGKTEREARLYVNGGCQETIVEGVEHSAGAYYYFNMLKVLDFAMQPPPSVLLSDAYYSPEAARFIPPVIEQANGFDDYYSRLMNSMKTTIAVGAEWLRKGGVLWPQIHPCPLFSVNLQGCIERAVDYTAGGALYNPAGIALVGLGTLTDSLHAVKVAVFDEGWLTLEQYRRILADNWMGHEPLRSKILALPKYGHHVPVVDALAARLCSDLASFSRTLVNERGGPFQPSFFVYYTFHSLGKTVRATPDGRRNGDLLSQGVAPSRLRPPSSLTEILNSLSTIDFTDYPGNAVLDLQMPTGSCISTKQLAGVLRTFAKLGGPTMQINCVSPNDLKDAQVHPELHRNLIVRISGLSAHFVALTREVQDEIIGRITLPPKYSRT